MQEIELVKGDFSHPPLNDDISNVSLYNFSDYNTEYEYYYTHPYHDSPIRLKWDEKNQGSEWSQAQCFSFRGFWLKGLG